ncbi:hypothetical protein DXG01_003809 [Tephrocybe rancida]|nr:hypothetical protein DXG01_003809 [Tephrocybe rancida]
MSRVIAAHAQHIFDWDSFYAGQYFFLTTQAKISINGTFTLGPKLELSTFFPNTSVESAIAAVQPFINQVLLLGTSVMHTVIIDSINHGLNSSDDNTGLDFVMGSRLVDVALIIVNKWNESTPVATVRKIETTFRDKQLPILQKLAPPGAGAYSNEADGLETDFQTTFYGPNYAGLSAIKSKYDPTDLFIVKGGVGSERWDASDCARSDYPMYTGHL